MPKLIVAVFLRSDETENRHGLRMLSQCLVGDDEVVVVWEGVEKSRLKHLSTGRKVFLIQSTAKNGYSYEYLDCDSTSVDDFLEVKISMLKNQSKESFEKDLTV